MASIRKARITVWNSNAQNYFIAIILAKKIYLWMFKIEGVRKYPTIEKLFANRSAMMCATTSPLNLSYMYSLKNGWASNGIHWLKKKTTEILSTNSIECNRSFLNTKSSFSITFIFTVKSMEIETKMKAQRKFLFKLF